MTDNEAQDGASNSEPSQPMIEVVTSAAAQSDQARCSQPLPGLSQESGQQQSLQLDSRIQALEASSRRIERKVDQILDYCRIMAQAMAPA